MIRLSHINPRGNKLKIVHIRVKDIHKNNFSDAQDRNSIGILDDETEDHLYIKPFKKDIDYKSFIGSTVRYPIYAIDYEEVENV